MTVCCVSRSVEAVKTKVFPQKLAKSVQPAQNLLTADRRGWLCWGVLVYSTVYKYSTKCAKGLRVHCTVGWSDLALFRFFETFTFRSIRYIFRSSIQKNRQFWPCAQASHTQQSLHFQKSTGTLKIHIFIENLQKPFLYIIEHSQKLKFKIKICLIFFSFLKLGKTFFDLYKFLFSFCLCF